MEPDSKIPKDALHFIQECVRGCRIHWTYHVNMRLAGRYISRQDILEAVDSYEIVEAYPLDKYLPSYLVLAKHGGSVFQILFAADVEGDNIRIITAYHPDPKEWEMDFKTRRKTK